MSSAGAECVRAPTLTRSTPDSAMARGHQGHAAGRLQQHARRRRIAPPHRLASGPAPCCPAVRCPARHQGRVQLWRSSTSISRGKRRPYFSAACRTASATAPAPPDRGKMVVLDEHAVAETHAVVVTAATAHRVLLQQPGQPGVVFAACPAPDTAVPLRPGHSGPSWSPRRSAVAGSLTPSVRRSGSSASARSPRPARRRAARPSRRGF